MGSYERLGEDVRKLTACADVVDVDLPIVNALADEMETKLDVFALAWKTRFLHS